MSMGVIRHFYENLAVLFNFLITIWVLFDEYINTIWPFNENFLDVVWIVNEDIGVIWGLDEYELMFFDD